MFDQLSEALKNRFDILKFAIGFVRPGVLVGPILSLTQNIG
jgi:hypothetical protein